MERYQQSMERGHYATCHHYSPGKFSLEFYYFNLLLWENLSILLLRLSHIKAIQKSKWQRTIPQLQVTQAEVYQINAFYWLLWRWPYSCQQINPQFHRWFLYSQEKISTMNMRQKWKGIILLHCKTFITLWQYTLSVLMMNTGPSAKDE